MERGARRREALWSARKKKKKKQNKTPGSERNALMKRSYEKERKKNKKQNKIQMSLLTIWPRFCWLLCSLRAKTIHSQYSTCTLSFLWQYILTSNDSKRDAQHVTQSVGLNAESRTTLSTKIKPSISFAEMYGLILSVYFQDNHTLNRCQLIC